MANDYFQFKQFTIWQDACAMKVCTDSCLFGSLLPIKNMAGKPIQNVLDVGTGTGLLSLMYAQQNALATIMALEIEPKAAKQAIANIEQSRFAQQIEVLEKDFFQFSTNELFDLIICNPPFYKNDLAPIDLSKQLAHHNADFSLAFFLQDAIKKITNVGCIAILLPYKRNAELLVIAKNLGLFVVQEYLVKQTTKHDYFRVIYIFSTKEIAKQTEIITIKKDMQYTERFQELLQTFYLKIPTTSP
jgi:tRNA1Val (adenine37-N6)-methyltransferase